MWRRILGRIAASYRYARARLLIGTLGAEADNLRAGLVWRVLRAIDRFGTRASANVVLASWRLKWPIVWTLLISKGAVTLFDVYRSFVYVRAAERAGEGIAAGGRGFEQAGRGIEKGADAARDAALAVLLETARRHGFPTSSAVRTAQQGDSSAAARSVIDDILRRYSNGR